MKTTILGILFSAALFIVPLPASAQQWDDMNDFYDIHDISPGHGMGMMGGMGMGPGGCAMDGHGRGGYERGGMMGLGPIETLNLNPDQRSRMNKIRNDARKQHWSLMGRILDERAKLYDLYAVDRPDPKKIGQVYGAIFDVRRQMIETQIDAMNRAKDILNKDQLEKLKQLQGTGGKAPGGVHQDMMQEMMQGGGSGTAR